MGALFSRIKVWVSAEDVVYSDLNSEFDNILNNLTAANVDDFSTNVSQMQSTTDPGEVGTESLATSVAGEIARLRHLIKEITGETYWYTSPDASIATLASLLGTGLQDNRIASGRVRTTSQQPLFLKADGAARTVNLIGANTAFVYYVDGTQYTISSNVALTSLTAAPTANNTCLVNDTVAADQVWTKYTGEDGSEIPIDTAGTEITALVGKFAAFRLDNGSASEYLTAYVESSTRLTKAKRGFFFDSADTPVQRIVYSNNDTLHLLKLTWIFAKTDGTLTASYTTPVISKDEPSSPASNDYWFDMVNATWKKYDVSSFVAANATLIGSCAQNTTATIGSRSFEFFQAWEDSNTIEVTAESNSQVKSKWPGSSVSAWGVTHSYDHNLITWDMTLDLETGVTEAANTAVFFYITEQGDKVISDIRPYDRREDLKGFYHPYNSWRAVGEAYNNASQNLTSINSKFSRYDAKSISTPVAANANIELVSRIIPVNAAGGALTLNLPPASFWKGQTMTYVKEDNTPINAVTLDFYGSEALLNTTGRTNFKLHTKGQSVTLSSDGTNVFVVNHYIPTYWVNIGPITITAVVTAPTKGTIIRDQLNWRRDGSDVLLLYQYDQSTGSGGGGSGEYYWHIPSNVCVPDTSILPEWTVAAGNIGGTSSSVLQKSLCGHGHHGVTSSSSNHVYAYLINTTVITVTAGATAIGSASNGFTNTNNGLSFLVRLPVVGWES